MSAGKMLRLKGLNAGIRGCQSCAKFAVVKQGGCSASESSSRQKCVNRNGSIIQISSELQNFSSTIFTFDSNSRHKYIMMVTYNNMKGDHV